MDVRGDAQQCEAIQARRGAWCLVLRIEGKIAGGVPLNQWHEVSLTYAADHQSVMLNGEILSKIQSGCSDGWAMKMSMDAYVFASVDDFSIRSA